MRALLVCLIVSLLQPIRSSPDCAAQGWVDACVEILRFFVMLHNVQLLLPPN